MFSRLSVQKRNNELKAAEEKLLTNESVEFHIESDQEQEEEDEVQNCLDKVLALDSIKVGDFVLVGTGKSRKHYVAQVTSLEDDEVQLSFTFKSWKQYIWPEEEKVENKWIPMSQIHLKLNFPSVDRRGQLLFSNDDLKSIDDYCNNSIF